MSAVTELVIGGYAPAATSHGEGLAAFGHHLEHLTNGALRVRIAWNILDEGRPASELLARVEEGEMFACYFSTSYLVSRVPALGVLEIPYLFTDLAHAHRALDGGLGRALSEETEARTGFAVLGYWDNGFRHLSNRLRPIRSPNDCVGLRVRVQPNRFHEKLIEAWGAAPVAVDLAEGIELIERGGVDAQENPLANTVAYGVHRLHRHITMTGHLYGARGVYVHRPTLHGLPSPLRDAVREAAWAAIGVQRQAAKEREAELRARLEGEGVAFVDLTEEERAAFVSASRPVRAEAVTAAGEALVESALAGAVRP